MCVDGIHAFNWALIVPMAFGSGIERGRGRSNYTRRNWILSRASPHNTVIVIALVRAFLSSCRRALRVSSSCEVRHAHGDDGG